ncbi:DALR anticodon-binding domain-containing protein [Streptomyces xanthophaeus]|uniref:ArgS-related anticodon-binding protein NrtL n=1 Tax=Streptomyces xanthophaeus TaxID=67385 RepID=UPI00386420AF|nr:DALR anticodon-binding domain-containing protein [Streptomyces xanthophaeus]WST60340.1 DALR anticodon-binding domain-containing protein [Streptomyces xanthophaeus]
MTPADLSRTVVRAVRCAVEDGELPAGADVPGGRAVVERTRPGGVGDYATPVAFQVAKGTGRRPADVAQLLARRLDGVSGIEQVEVTGAGFLNFVLAPPDAAEVVRAALAYAPAPRPDAPAPLPEAAGPSPSAPNPNPSPPPPAVSGLREQAVHAAVLRIRAGQGLAPAPPAVVAPVARRDGDVLARYGADAVRWAALTVAPQETPVFSPALLLQGEAAEFFRVRYAHARSRALLRNAARLGFTPLPGPPQDSAAGPLLRALGEYPLVLEAAAHHRAPERLARHLVTLADALLDFQYCVLPHGDEKPSAAHRARLALAEAAGTVLAGGLALLGIDAPERL